jgi:DNA polymerase-3 subunit gamma/tau
LRFQLNAFLKRFKSHETEYIILSREVELDEHYTIHLTLDNTVQEDALTQVKPDLLDFLRSQLKNYAIQLQSQVKEVSASKRPYTLNEKLQYLTDQNPLVAELKKRFGLDTDY